MLTFFSPILIFALLSTFEEHYTLGKLYLSEGDLEKSREEFILSLPQKEAHPVPWRDDVYLFLAEIDSQRGFPEQAKTWLQNTTTTTKEREEDTPKSTLFFSEKYETLKTYLTRLSSLEEKDPLYFETREQMLKEYPAHPLSHEWLFIKTSPLLLPKSKEVKEFVKSHPQHPLLTILFYAKGILRKEQDWLMAKESFDQAFSHFDSLQKEHKIPVYWKEWLEEYALLALKQKIEINFEKMEVLSPLKRSFYLEELKKDIYILKSNKNSQEIASLFSFKLELLDEHISYPKMFEILQKELHKSSESYRSKILILISTLQEKKGLYTEALHTLKQRSIAHFSPQEELQLKLKEAFLLERLDHVDEALQTYSRIINTPTRSSLRIEAMVKRGLLLYKIGKNELAFKQLYNASTKGGDWGKKGKGYLKELYGIE